MAGPNGPNSPLDASAFAGLMAARVGAQRGLPPPSRPFAGVSGTSKTAANLKVPHLQARLALASALHDRLTQGGLATAPVRQREASAVKTISHAVQPAADSPMVFKPPPGSLTPDRKAAINLILGAPPAPTAVDAAAKPAPGMVNPRGALGAASDKAQGGVNLGSILHGAANALSTAAGTAISSPIAAPGLPMSPGSLLAPFQAAEGNTPTPKLTTLPQATRGLASTALSAAGGFGDIGLNTPSPSAIEKALSVQIAGAAGRHGMTPQQYIAAGLVSKEQTTALRGLALKRGWTNTELDPLVGTDLMKHAFSNPPPEPLRTLQNLGAGVIRTAALVNVVPAGVQEIASGHGERFATQLAGSLTSRLPIVGQHPFGEMALGDPYGTFPVVGGVAKTLGGIGGKLAEAAGAQLPDRMVTLAGTGGLETVNRGALDRNFYNQIGQKTSDLAASKLRSVGNRVLARHVDQIHSDQVNEIAPGHYVAGSAQMKALNAVSPKRAEVIMEAQRVGAFHSDGRADPVVHAILEKHAAD